MPNENNSENLLDGIDEAEEFEPEETTETPAEAESKEETPPSSKEEEKPAEKKEEAGEGETKTPDKKDERWRDKYFKLKQAQSISAPTEKPTEDETPQDDKEKAAKSYIENVIKEVLSKEKQEEDKAVTEFEDTLNKTLEDNPDVKESSVLDIIEEYEDELSGLPPEKIVTTAIKIAKKQQEFGIEKPKPRMPTSRRASPNVEATPKKETDVKDKTMWQLAQEAISEMRNSKK